MIYQLVRLGWRRFWLAALIFAVVLWGLGFATMTRPLWSALLSGVTLIVLLFAPVSAVGRFRASLFQAALPIPAWDLFMARLLPLLGLVWIPLLAAVGAGYIVVGRASSFRTLWLIAVGAVATVGALVLLSVRLQELSVHHKLFGRLVVATEVVAFFVLGGTMAYSVRPGTVLVACAGTIAALLWRDMAAMPKAFQVAPANAVAERPSRRWIGFPRPVWWPVCRSMIARRPWAMNGLAWSVALTLYPMASVLASLMLAGFFVQGWLSMPWVWALPVSRRKMLAVGLLSPLVLEAAVQAAKPAGLIQAAEFVAVALLCTSSHLVIHNRSRLLAGARFLAWTSFIVCFCAPLALAFADIYYGGVSRKYFWRSYTAEHLAAHLAGIPLALLVLLVAGTLAGLGTLYWLVQRQFEAADFLPPPQVRLDTGAFSTGYGA
jgi:hypothetical protein